MNLTKYVGDRGFWRVTLRLALPIAFQNMLTSSFSLVDTLMVSMLGDISLAAAGMAGTVRGFADPERGIGSTTVTDNHSRTVNNSFAPSFVLNLNGTSATAGNERKVRRWVRDGINDALAQIGRQNGYSMA